MFLRCSVYLMRTTARFLHCVRGITSISTDDSLLAVPYRDFDVLISDIDENELIEIGAAYNIENMSVGAFSSTPFPAMGRIHERNFRLMIPLKQKILNVWFLANSSSPYTYLTVKMIEELVGPGFSHDLHNIVIHDSERYIECHISRAHFANVNSLGMYAMEGLEVSIDFD
ncbi:unnamed protein product [Auanema sp. JU1783]|nr:unnamed protein product [Auanema sp. JU1783]